MMIRTRKTFAPLLLALVATATAAGAQSPQPPQPPARQAPSAETMDRLQDGRFAMIKTALKLSDAQLKLWEPVEAQMRAQHAAFLKARQERGTAPRNSAAVSLPDRIELSAKRQADGAERQRAFAAVLKPFFSALSDEQKAIAERLLTGHGGGHERFARHEPRRGMQGRSVQ